MARGLTRFVGREAEFAALQHALEPASVSYGRATPYFPIIDLLKRYAHVEAYDDARTVRAKVTGQVLTLDDALQATLPAFLTLLEALLDDSPFQQLDPPQQRQRTLEALKRVLVGEGAPGVRRIQARLRLPARGRSTRRDPGRSTEARAGPHRHDPWVLAQGRL